MIENYELIREMHTNKSHPFTVLTDLRDANHGYCSRINIKKRRKKRLLLAGTKTRVYIYIYIKFTKLFKTVNKTYYEVRFKNEIQKYL